MSMSINCSLGLMFDKVVIQVSGRSRGKPLGYETGQYASSALQSGFYLSISSN